jgi:predicted amidophosphoribosyltransferase
MRVRHLIVTGLSQCCVVPLHLRADDRTMFAALLSILAPPLCIACAADAGRAAPLCRECRSELARSAGGSGGIAWTAYPYDGPAGAMVRALKFGSRIPIADVMAAQVASNAPPGLLAGALVPVPVHDDHRRRRGLAHAALLAEALGRRTGLPVADCLERHGDPRPQVGRGRRERLAGIAGTIAVRAGAVVPARAVLVDDVVTTGATVGACAGALRAAGTVEVAAAVYARTAAR